MNQPDLIPDLHAVANGDVRRDHPRLILPRLLNKAAIDFRLPEKDEAAVHAIILKWADMESRGRLRPHKETQLEPEFLTEVFGQVLGYSILSEFPDEWELWPKFSVPGGITDAAIGRFSHDGPKRTHAVVELKGPAVNVDRDRFNGRTPIQQCWDYMYALPGCPWGIVCNYVGFRLYHRDKTPRAFEHFTLQDLRDIGNFRKFRLVFGHDGLLPLTRTQRALMERLLADTDNRQRQVGRELYHDYHENRVALIQHLRKPPHDKSVEDAIHIAQKVLDRIIFVAFCEDRDLVPERSLEKAWTQVAPFRKVTNPRWQNFLALFRSIDAGNPEFGISRFNGGLFEVDPEVDGLDLGDEWTDFFKEVGGYDFRDEVSLDVLGHLFEQSITDLETLRASPDSWDTTRPKKVSGKRKREGVYYTPPHVTRYIVEKTVGACLAERFAALASDFDVNPQAEPTEKTLADWLKYQGACLEALRGLRVCDMACGSGAFLIQAFDHLEEVYNDVIAALCLHQGKSDEELREQVKSWILSDNLFGVDRSEEAVEITRLALWIRTAERGKTLADLSQNIQCGNSIVDDPKADACALDWQRSFPQVFAEGGFDCIISNPPYVKLQNFRKREPRVAKFLAKRYRSAQTGNFDMYLPFIERGLELLRPGGRMGFIAPNVWLFNEYGEGLRRLLAEKKALERFVDFKSHQVFEDATTYTALQFFSAQATDAIRTADASHGNLRQLSFYAVPYKGLGDGAWSLLEPRAKKILDKMRERSVRLEEASRGLIVGIQTSADTVYHLTRLAPGRYWSRALKKEVQLEDEIMKPLVSGRHIASFSVRSDETYLLFPYLVALEECRLLEPEEIAKPYRRAWVYLKENESQLRARESGAFDDDRWWRFGRHQNIDKQTCPKLMVPRLLHHLCAAVDYEGGFYLDNVDVGGVLVKTKWKLGYVAAVLNSMACDYAWRLTSKPFRGAYRSANKQFVAPLPIPKARSQKPLADLARRLADLHAERVATMKAVHRRFAVDLAPAELIATSPVQPKLPRKLAAFDELQLGQLIDGIEKYAKRKFTPAQRGRWDEYLTDQVNTVAGLKTQIADLMAELNNRANRLYGLSAEDVKVINESSG